ncbi:TPA: hypothetical protein N0F65_003020, partial [Lagenidium giganteum]
NERKRYQPATFVHGATIEIIWTTIPALILLTVAVPSFALLYSMDEVIDPVITLNVIGSQWYWTYEYLSSHLSGYSTGCACPLGLKTRHRYINAFLTMLSMAS